MTKEELKYIEDLVKGKQESAESEQEQGDCTGENGEIVVIVVETEMGKGDV